MSGIVRNDIVEELKAACEGLLFSSETDAPLEPFHWPDYQGPLSEQRVAELAQAPAKAPIVAQSVDEFFRPATTEEDWQNEEEKAEARKFQHLVQVLKDNLHSPQVYLVGETNLDVYVIGKVEDGLAGVKTQVVET